MASSILDSFYYKGMYGTSAMTNVFSDEGRINAWLAAEVALAKGEARVGVIPQQAADAIAEAAKLENLDLQAMKVEFNRVGFPIMPLVHQLAKACDPESGRWVHWGSTTQDILDTGLVLQMREGIALLEQDLNALIAALAKLAETHRNTVMAGRTFQQQAAPITFGYKVAVWLDEMLRHKERLAEVKTRVLVGQCAGAVGTLATLGKDGLAVQRAMMAELDLAAPTVTWHTARDSWAEMVNWLVLVTSTLGKVATEIATLMRTEVNEVREPYQTGRGASSTLPQKRNPIACPRIIAIAHRMREFSAAQFSAMIQEHERAVGAMPIEWMVIPEAFMLASGSLSQSLDILGDLEVDAAQMRANLNLGGGLLMAEAVMMGIAPLIGRNQAHDLVFTAAGRANDAGQTLRETLIEDQAIMEHVTVEQLDVLLDPANYTGSAGAMVDAVLAKWEAMKERA
ncbi:adenylosuccinate lyase family protein [Halomonas campisalis]|uniref:Adenylosuccinate lyase family protein n=1 Tax=Billgrantia campisalis TaxID=74661 RepID=A0ABS9P4K1_9GAMM|nr:adenylosuccinate lyase family protein [Halomonas campisalis]MCG6656339.1 adenylosuccinate lyase family protein [Halomonas campisalis]MDR5861524.1 adenylosuccinate lyase family protein [Halomonas campisalis]